ncbi:nucleic acid-binding domain protein [Winkia neuii]|uniref:OB-fold nucleic acid binding domain-containing protein n=1 Tax=Winkia neuii TaxID=33007 RepID=UPI000763E222|nr:OB-fold nucleic acid binding domain-containing protein [Winkia neuii]KWZ72139.1 nucleic acid-binding domain protein [Winkia neuii]
MSRLIRLVRTALASLWLSRGDIGAADEKAFSERVGAQPISQVSERKEIKIAGVITSVTYPARTGLADLSATLSDGSATIELVWMGRHDIPGIVPGARLLLSGTASLHRDHLRVVNPDYSLLAHML